MTIGVKLEATNPATELVSITDAQPATPGGVLVSSPRLSAALQRLDLVDDVADHEQSPANDRLGDCWPG